MAPAPLWAVALLLCGAHVTAPTGGNPTVAAPTDGANLVPAGDLRAENTATATANPGDDTTPPPPHAPPPGEAPAAGDAAEKGEPAASDAEDNTTAQVDAAVQVKPNTEATEQASDGGGAVGGGAKGAEGEQPPSGAEGGPSAPAAEPTEPAAPSALPTKSAPVIPETPAPADLDNDEMTYEAFRDAVNEAEVESGVDETEDHSHVGSKEHHINYASVSCGAQVINANDNAKNAYHVLIDDDDKYLLNPCESNAFLVVELCADIQIHSITLSNREMFSSMVTGIHVKISNIYPVKDASGWTSLGSFTGKDTHEMQVFNITEPQHFAKFMRIEFSDYVGTEHYCPISSLKVYGWTMIEEYNYREQLAQGKQPAGTADASNSDEVGDDPAEQPSPDSKAEGDAAAGEGGGGQAKAAAGKGDSNVLSSLARLVGRVLLGGEASDASAEPSESAPSGNGSDSGGNASGSDVKGSPSASNASSNASGGGAGAAADAARSDTEVTTPAAPPTAAAAAVPDANQSGDGAAVAKAAPASPTAGTGSNETAAGAGNGAVKASTITAVASTQVPADAPPDRVVGVSLANVVIKDDVSRPHATPKPLPTLAKDAAPEEDAGHTKPGAGSRERPATVADPANATANSSGSPALGNATQPQDGHGTCDWRECVTPTALCAGMGSSACRTSTAALSPRPRRWDRPFSPVTCAAVAKRAAVALAPPPAKKPKPVPAVADKKASIYSQLASKIKALEKNVTISGRFLEALSGRLKKLNSTNMGIIADIRALQLAANGTIDSAVGTPRFQALERATLTLVDMVEGVAASVDDLKVTCERGATVGRNDAFFGSLFGVLVGLCVVPLSRAVERWLIQRTSWGLEGA